MSIQLDLFEKVDEFTLLKEEVKALKTSADNVRRGLFARHNELAKMIIQTKAEYEALSTELYKLKQRVAADEMALVKSC